MLPGGRAVLFTILASDKAPQAAVYHLERGETRSLFEGMSARFVGPGHVVFGRQGKLWAVGFDPESLETTGAARPVRDDVLWSVQGYPQFAVGAGVLAYVRTPGVSNRTGNRVLAWIDRNGTRRDLPLKADNFHLPRLSPTGDRFVVQIGIDRALWAYDLSRGTMTRLVSDRIIAYSAPSLDAPTGRRVVFTAWFDGRRRPRLAAGRTAAAPVRRTHHRRWHALVRADQPGDAARRQRRGPDRLWLPARRSRICCSCRSYWGATPGDPSFRHRGVERECRDTLRAGASSPTTRTRVRAAAEVYVRPFSESRLTKVANLSGPPRRRGPGVDHAVGARLSTGTARAA